MAENSLDDHEELAERLRKNIYKAMSPAQKYAEFKKLYATARYLKAAGVRMQHPNWSEEEVLEEVRKIFLYATT